MNKFVIVTDSCSDLTKGLRTQYDIDYIPMHTICDGTDTPASLDWEYIPCKEFYTRLRNGTRFMTAQITQGEYIERFTQYLEQGYDILSISCSSALSASVKGSYMARDELLQKYTDRKIYCVDSLNSCFGLGMLCITASKMRQEGKTIDEVYDWLEANKLKANQFCTVDSLEYLRRAGRVAAGKAFFSGLLNIKPIIISDADGQNNAVDKVMGRKLAIKKLVTDFVENYESSPYQIVCVAHADCEEEALAFKQKIVDALPDKDVPVLFNTLGPIIGASAGPGTIAVYFYGKEVTYRSAK